MKCLVSMAKRRQLKPGLYRLYDCICKTQGPFQKTEVKLGGNIAWLPLVRDLLVNLKPAIHQPKHRKQMNPGLCPSILNGFTKPTIYRQLWEYAVSMANRRKLKPELYCLYDCAYKTQVLFQKAEVKLWANIAWHPLVSHLLVNLKPAIYQPKHKKQMNTWLCSLVFNGFIKSALFH